MTAHQYPTYTLRQTFDRLPACAKHRYRALQQMRDDAAALERSALGKIQLLEGETSDLIIRLRSVDSAEVDTVNSIREELATLAGDIGRIDQERVKRQGLRANTEQVLAYLNEFVTTQLGLDRAGADASGFRAVTVELDPSDREDPRSALLAVRNEIATIKAEIVALRHAPLPGPEIAAKLTADIDRLAALGAPQMDFGNGQVKLTFSDDNRFAAPGAALAAPTGSASRLVAWLFRDELVAKVTAGVDEIVGVSLSEREQRSGELQRRLLLLDHREEALVVYLLDQNVEVHRRPGCSGLALLGIGIAYDTPAESEPLPIAAE
jgi:hypothetical protein